MIKILPSSKLPVHSKVVPTAMLGFGYKKGERTPFLTQPHCTAELVTLRFQSRLYKSKASISPNQVIFLQKTWQRGSGFSTLGSLDILIFFYKTDYSGADRGPAQPSPLLLCLSSGQMKPHLLQPACHLHLNSRSGHEAGCKDGGHPSLNCFSLAGTFYFSTTKDDSVLPWRVKVDPLLSAGI